jgi:serine/threonine protein kinase
MNISKKIIVLDDTYDFLQELGSGTYGIVYKVRKISNGKIYALKVMERNNRSVDINDIDHEYSILKKLGDKCNQGLVCYHKLFKAMRYSSNRGMENYYCLLMDYVDGVDLLKYIDNYCKDEYLSDEQILTFMICVTQTLKLLHDNNIVHRDIKPANILYTEDKLILVDYGSMCYLSESKENRLCDGGIELGTNAYYSPELWAATFKNKKTLPDDKLKSIDVWALGITFFQLINCKFPYDLNNSPEELYEIMMSGKLDTCIKPNKKIADVVNLMLTPEYKNRPTITEIYSTLKDMKL